MSRDSGTIVALGVFDGLHLGHRSLLGRLVEEARRSGLASVVVSFERHPGCVLGRRADELWLDEQQDRERAIMAMGVDRVVMMDFTPELAALSACQFVEQVLVARYGMRKLFLGYDSRFGNRTRDDFDQLPALAQRLGLEILHDEPLLVEGQPISSTRVRQSLMEGDVATAARLLGGNYRLRGQVVKGRQVGRQLGFPTANVDLAECRKMAPSDGVYSVVLHCGERCWKGMANLGDQPTFEDGRRALEVHLIDFSGNLYGEHVEVEFVARLRGIVKFGSKEELVNQLNQDKSRII